MTVADILLIAALAAFTAAWWVRALPGRPRVLLLTALLLYFLLAEPTTNPLHRRN